jgi:twitching motility protein PilT
MGEYRDDRSPSMLQLPTEPCSAVLPGDGLPPHSVRGRNGFSELLTRVIEEHATDLHLKVPSPPVLRIDGRLVPQLDLPAVTPEYVEHVLEEIATAEQRTAFASERELDFAYSVHGLGRFRVNAFRQRGTASLAFRLVPFDIPSVDSLELPQVCKDLILRPRGLILVTGPAGSGKSTTLAAMINHLNEREQRNVVTVEDPIEYLFADKKCLIQQRDLGDDTKSFSNALIHVLRHDPDVIVIGEMRDLGTISTAMTAAETGHLVLATLHTIDAPQSIHRIIDVFPPDQQRQVRLQLSEVIEAVLSQTLLPRVGGGRVGAFEIMLANSVIRRLIRDDKVHEISATIEMGTPEGMQTMDQALAQLVLSGNVAKEEALRKSSHPIKFNELLQNTNKAHSLQTSPEVNPGSIYSYGVRPEKLAPTNPL